MRSLAELTAIVSNSPFKRVTAFATRWEICSACTIGVCNTSSPGCGVRQKLNADKRRKYAQDPERHRARNRAFKADKLEHYREEARAYYAESREIILVKRKEARKADPEKTREQDRIKRERQKQRKLQEGATQ